MSLKWIMIVVFLLGLLTSPSLSQSNQVPSADPTIRSPDSSVLSFNNSTIYYAEQKSVSPAPVSLSVGSGYYASHPIGYFPQAGGVTWIENSRAATSLHQEVNYAQGIDGEIEVWGKESSLQSGGDYYQQSGLVSMVINEDVTSGRVHIGVLQGDPGQAGSIGANSPTMAGAWKNPSLEIEEEYVGTYHIEKNLSINLSRRSSGIFDGWLECCYKGFSDMRYFDRPAVSAETIFGSYLVEG